MDDSKEAKMTENQQQTPQQAQPNEQGALHIQGHIKIFDVLKQALLPKSL